MPFMISGIVKNQSTGAPVSWVEVELTFSIGLAIKSVKVPANNGEFSVAFDERLLPELGQGKQIKVDASITRRSLFGLPEDLPVVNFEIIADLKLQNYPDREIRVNVPGLAPAPRIWGIVTAPVVGPVRGRPGGLLFSNPKGYIAASTPCTDDEGRYSIPFKKLGTVHQTQIYYRTSV